MKSHLRTRVVSIFVAFALVCAGLGVLPTAMTARAAGTFSTAPMVATGWYGPSLALKSDGTVCAWGTYSLGAGSIVSSNVPVQVVNLTGVTAVATGSGFALALKSDGTVWTWGYNDYGQLGDGSNTDSNVPVQVKDLTNAAKQATAMPTMRITPAPGHLLLLSLAMPSFSISRLLTG